VALSLATFVFVPSAFAQADSNLGGIGGAGRSTVLPTDVVPLPLPEERRAVGESLKFRIFQKLPSRFYMNATCETSGRIETNVFQFPTKRQILNSATFNRGVPFGALSGEDQLALGAAVDRASQADSVYRVTPNITAGWALGPNTRVFGNYFYLRDKLARFNTLNTYINQVGTGIEHNISLPKRANLELQFMTRELWQVNADPVFDYIPSTTLSIPIRNNTIAYFNALAQFRSLNFFGAVNREIDPFFTIGALHQRGTWSYSANMTYLVNFRRGFKDASIDVNSQTIICDFEIAKQLFKKIPGFQGFIRAEPVYNFGTDNLPGLAGMDFRLFYGVRGAVSKPPLVGTIQLLKQRYQDPPKQQADPNKGKKKDPKGKTNTTDPAKTQPGDGNKEPQKDDPVGGPSAESVPNTDGAQTAQDTKSAPAEGELTSLASQTTSSAPAEIIPCSSDAILETAVPMHGFITDTEKEVSDANLISGLNRAKDALN
jgi:hypothetical protein